MSKKGFTLIEVMISVVLISVIIASLYQLKSNYTFLFEKAKNEANSFWIATFFNTDKYGFKNDTVTLDRLSEGFDLDDDLRRFLKNKKTDIIYQEVRSIDLSETDTNQTQNSNMTLTIGKTVLKSNNGKTAFYRVEIK